MKSHSLISLALLLFFSHQVFGADLYVTRFDDHDDGNCGADCSLREAISFANSHPGYDYIHLADGTYTIDIPPEQNGEYDDPFIEEDNNVNGDFDIRDTVVILGVSFGNTTIKSKVRDRIFEVISGHAVFHSLTLNDGKTYDYGGAIENHSLSVLYYCNISNNRAFSMFRGGNGAGIANFGDLRVYFSRIENNYANSGEGDLGRGGGIYNDGDLTIRDSSIRFNKAFDDNDASTGGGIYNKGQADIRRSLIQGNQVSKKGSAIMVDVGGYLKLVSSTVTENLSEWWTPDSGGAVRNERGTTVLTHVTIADNSDMGIYSNGKTYVKNSIVVKNNYYDYDENNYVNCHIENNIFYSIGSVMGDSDSNCPSDFLIEDDDTFISLLEPLANNGGWTDTFALKPDELAIDNGYAPCPRFDQRAEATEKDGNSDGNYGCDIGAFELQ